MYKLLFIAKKNMRKQRSDMITFLILTCLAAFMIFDSISALLGMNNVLEDKFAEINGAHFLLYNGDSEAETDSAKHAITENKYIKEYEMTPCIDFGADYKNEKDDEYSTYQFIVEDYDADKKIMKVVIPEFAHNVDDILLPLNMKSNFAIGDKLQIKLEDDIYTFNVAGYIEDPYFCSTMNITTFSTAASKEMIEKIADEHPDIVRKRNMHKGVADTSTFPKEYDTNDLESEIMDVYKNNLSEYAKKETDANYTMYMGLNWDTMKGGSQLIPLIVMAIILLFATIILVVALIIISFSIKNFIQRNMKNTGIMEAAGYTVKELRWALTIELMIVSMIGGLVGVLLGTLTFKSFGDILSSVLGLSWNQKANIIMAIFTVIGLVFIVFLVSRFISRTYKKITVLDALRGGINAHNYKKNYFSFEKTSLPVPFVLSLKDTFGGIGRNIVMIFITLVLTIATLAGIGMKENYGDDPEPLFYMMGFESGTAEVLNPKGGDISEGLRSIPGVKNVLVTIGFEPNILFNGQKKQVYTYAVDDFKNTLNTLIIEGRMPEKENEIMLTNGVALDLGAKVGDVVELEFANEKKNFIVTGINQRIERMGRSMYMLISSTKDLLPGDLTSTYRYLVTAEDNVTFDAIKSEVEKMALSKGITLKCENLKKTLDSTVETLNSSMKAICYIILVLTTLLVIFVESLVIRAKINREWRNLGISKTLGQTSVGLMIQIMLTNIPAVTVGALIGALLAERAGKAFTKACFTLFAMKEAKFDISLNAIIICIVGIIGVAIITSFLTGLKVRRLIPVEMITEE